MQRKLFYYLFLILLLPAVVSAGTRGTIKGKVTDLQSGEPLIGANVIVDGTSQGASTDVNGEFQIQNLEAGVYTLKSSFIGYQTVTISNVRVSADLTTEMNFQLPAEGISVGTITIIAPKPLVNKDNTNAIRVTTSDDINALPVRGVNNIVGLTAGVVLKDNAVFIRGGRIDEVGYYLEGVSITNPMTGGRAVSISQDAIEEIQVQAGGYTAEFGGANSGIVRQQLKSGGSQMKASLEYITDNIGFQGKDQAYSGKSRLGAYWYGYNEMSAVLSGPVLDQRFKFFGNVDYNFRRDPSPQPYPGVNMGPIVDKQSNDSINLIVPAGAAYGSSQEWTTYTGTLNMDFTPVLVRLSGTYTGQRNDVGYYPVTGFLEKRLGVNYAKNGTFNVKLTHVLSSNMFYELSGGYYLQNSVTEDPYLKDNFWAYGDSAANAKAGFVWQRSASDLKDETKNGPYTPPSSKNIMGFSFVGDGNIPVNYAKNSRNGITFNGNLSWNPGKNHSIKLGGEYQQYTLRNWSTGGQAGFARSLYETMKANPNADYKKAQESLILGGGLNNYGYDIFGNETDAGIDAAHKPVFASGYIQDKIEYQDLVLNLGVRYDYFDVDNKMMKDPSKPELSINHSDGSIIEKGWVDVPTFSEFSPRLGFSFPVTDKTVFHAQYGKFVQQTRGLDMYQGYRRTGYELTHSFFFTNPVGKYIKPTRTTQYELGFTQQLTDFMSFDVTGYYKDVKDQVIFLQQTVDKNSPFRAYNSLANGDFATTKGLEMTFTMRRYERLALNGTLAFQDAEGTGSSPNANRGIVGAPIDGVAFTPKYIAPLDFNNALRANLNIDYRFGDDDGPAILHNFGVSVLMSYNSGHPFTRGIGGVSLESDARNRIPVEPLNSSTTPSVFQVDMRVDKTVSLYDKLSANIYIQVINLFDARNIENVFLRTGSTTDDGYISDPTLAAQLMNTYGDQYAELYKAVNIDYYETYQGASAQLQTSPLFYGPPRQIRLGIRLEY
ncbi:MAG TPA: TonB-dependent receptor [Ignavibacteriales bacterium]|nr:TonB-dependent receptor [Ignavibacteriales bacterium]